MLKDLILKNRSCRRFYEDEKISEDTLKDLVDLARLSPSAANAQPLRYILSNTPEMNEKIFPHLTWAGYLKEWKGPDVGEKPSAYIIILANNPVSRMSPHDAGIAAQSIMLGATEIGYGGCIIAAVHRDELRKELDIKSKHHIFMVLALGKPKEEVIIEELPSDGKIEYWRDDKNVHHVPKRTLKDIIVEK
ncbi:MAG: nitroreductase family protein [Candidatus Ancaeobacter aquaticus]|nr:nitroreductase family protein [Candidatus Ancaeobacter aquaticus]